MRARRLSNSEVAKLRELEHLLSRVIKKKERLKNIPNSESRISKGTEIQKALVQAMIWLEKGHASRMGEELRKLENLGLKVLP